MHYNVPQYQPINRIASSLEKQLNQGFRKFIHSLMGNKIQENNITVSRLVPKRNFFLDKYQALLNNGKTGNVQVINVEKTITSDIDKNIVVYITFQLIATAGVRLYTAVAMATRDNIPQNNTIIPIYYNADDFTVIVLL